MNKWIKENIFNIVTNGRWNDIPKIHVIVVVMSFYFAGLQIFFEFQYIIVSH